MKELNADKESLLFDFLRDNIKNKSKNNIKSLLTNKLISVNGKAVTNYDYKLKNGDVIRINNNPINTMNYKINVIYEDNDLIVVDKPSGLLTINNNKNEENLYAYVSSYVKVKNKNNKIFIVHRLDRDTSGIVIFAKNKMIKDYLQNNWNRIVRRYYRAIVYGKTKDHGIIESYLMEDKNGFVHVTHGNFGKKAITLYKTIKQNEKYSILEIEIKTGLKNQIRVQLSSINHPIVGDLKYNRDKSDHLYLHAYEVDIVDVKNGKNYKFITNIPQKFRKFI